MTDSMLPIIRQMHEAANDRERALLLLTVPDVILMKYREVFEAICRRAGFDAGLEFINWRRAGCHAVRGPDGLHKRHEFDAVRVAFAAFANHSAEGGKPDRALGPVARPSAAGGEAATGEGQS